MTDWHTTKHGNTGKTGQKGAAHHKAKFTDADVLAIRARYVERSRVHGTRAIANDYGVCKTTIVRIVRRFGWTHLEEGKA